MKEIELIIDLHKNSERQGPGSKNDTLKALGFMDLPNDQKLKVADIGCGSGGQTIMLAQNLNAQIIAVDLFPDFLNELNQKSLKLGLSEKISTLEKSMEDLPFGTEEFDIIWSEGAIYNMGFENGIRKWKEYLKVSGFLAVSELTWTSDSRPQEIDDFWTKEYPEIDTASNKIMQLEHHGFSLVGFFFLTQDSWMQNYYDPMKAKFDTFLNRNSNSKLAQKIVSEYQREIEIYMRYQEYFSYGFYVVRKN